VLALDGAFYISYDGKYFEQNRNSILERISLKRRTQNGACAKRAFAPNITGSEKENVLS
jgi:hypothetical protein